MERKGSRITSQLVASMAGMVLSLAKATKKTGQTEISLDVDIVLAIAASALSQAEGRLVRYSGTQAGGHAQPRKFVRRSREANGTVVSRKRKRSRRTPEEMRLAHQALNEAIERKKKGAKIDLKKMVRQLKLAWNLDDTQREQIYDKKQADA